MPIGPGIAGAAGCGGSLIGTAARTEAVGAKSNRDGTGAKVKIVSAAGADSSHVNSAVGYGGASDRRVHFGLGEDTVVQELTIAWSSGKMQTLKGVKADQVLSVRQPQ